MRSAGTPGRYALRKLVDRSMKGLLLLCTVAAITPLFLVFGYVLLKGLPALNWSFFLELPKPVGETGGGVANALLGTAILVALASAFGVPWGVLIGAYLSEYGRGSFASAVRFSVDLLSSIPSIIIGLFVYALVVIAMGHFSAVAGDRKSVV
jgi:phosphate transport system permease protein